MRKTMLRLSPPLHLTPQKVDAVRDWHLLLDTQALGKESSDQRHDKTVDRCCQPEALAEPGTQYHSALLAEPGTVQPKIEMVGKRVLKD